MLFYPSITTSKMAQKTEQTGDCETAVGFASRPIGG